MLVITGSLLAGGCIGALDTLGYEEVVNETNGSVGSPRNEDDRIADKNPQFDPGRLVTESFSQPSWSGLTCDVTLNKSAAVTKLDIIPFEQSEDALRGQLFRGRTEALAAAATLPPSDIIPSMEVVNGYLKPFNDGLYAAVELSLENGSDGSDLATVPLPGKRPLLTTLLARVEALRAGTGAGAAERRALEDAAVMLGTALLLGGDTPALADALGARAAAEAAAFTARPGTARPIGFYTWTAELGRVFTRDRFLQNRDGDISFGAFAGLALVLGQDAGLRADYQRIAALYAGLTNPYLSYPVDALIPYVSSLAALTDVETLNAKFSQDHARLHPCSWVPIAFLPASRSKEVDYFDAKYCDGIPAGLNLLDELVRAIRDGALDLAPASDAGWYDYQLYALETLLLPEEAPESQHLLLTAGYKRKLVETFKSILIQTRETHVKQLAISGRSSAEIPPVDIYPLLPAEPFPTFYLRTARGYRFLRTFLEATMGAQFLNTTTRLRESGDRATLPLIAELDTRIALLYGLFFLSADAVGMAPTDGLMADEISAPAAQAATAQARAWLATWTTDADVVRDPRVIIPIFEESVFTRYWAVIGVKALKIRAEFVIGHEPQVVSTGCLIGKIVPRVYTLLVEETVEVRLPSDRPPPTRAELRQICDGNTGKDAIVRALEAM